MINFEQLVENTNRPRSVVIYNSEDVNFRPFAFVLNVKNLDHAESINIAPGHTLRRAKQPEIAYVKQFISEQLGRVSSTSIWETKPTISGRVPRLPKKLRRYFVIEFENDDPDLTLLETVLAVAPVGLEIGFAKIKLNIKGVIRPACFYHTPSLIQSLYALEFASSHRDKLTESPGQADGEQIYEVFRRMAAHDHTILDLSRVVELLLELKDLPRFSPLQVLGYFAILESVLTHQPNPEDRYESITRQITGKLALLDKRWNPPLDYSQFPGASHERIWSKMYAYRSAIAHGREPDFMTQSQLALLQCPEAANKLIRDTVKKAIRQAYEEPQLVADLHRV